MCDTAISSDDGPIHDPSASQSFRSSADPVWCWRISLFKDFRTVAYYGIELDLTTERISRNVKCHGVKVETLQIIVCEVRPNRLSVFPSNIAAVYY
jgi:hypothetical protein